MAVPNWFLSSLGWKQATKKSTPRCMRYFGEPRGPNLADLSGTGSTRIAGLAYQILGIPTTRITTYDIGELEATGDVGDETQKSTAGSAAGTQLEVGLEHDIREGLERQSPGR